MRHNTVLVVEDEPAIAELVKVNLRHAGFSVYLAGNTAEAMRVLDTALPDVALVDWMLPGGSGLELVQRWRKNERLQRLPIIMLTARSDEKDTITGLEAGADDYITKPFSPRELIARIHALLRRRLPEKANTLLHLAGLQLDPNAHSVLYQGKSLSLGATEFRLLQYLMAHPARVHTRCQLLDKVWGEHICIEERTVDVHIKRLRGSLGKAGGLIETVRGVGYKFSNAGAKTTPATPKA